MRPPLRLATLTLLIAAGCGTQTLTKTKTVSLAPTSATSQVNATARFQVTGKQVKLTVNASGLTPGARHGIHIHENPACGEMPAGTPGGAAGPHWNPPPAASHGAWGMGAHHLGDIGNLTADAAGKGVLTLETDRWTLDSGVVETDVNGHALVIHALEDDGVNVASAGERVACGIID